MPSENNKFIIQRTYERTCYAIGNYPMVFIFRFKTLLVYKIKEKYGKRICCIWEKKFNQRNSEKLKTEKDGVNLKLDYGLLR